jgi:RHS repeat-associated protein
VRGQIAIPADEVIVATIGGASTRYVQVQGQILAQYEAGAWAYVLPDALGSMRQLVGDAGQVTLAQGYDPFGNLLEQVGAGQSGFGYTGEQEDPSIGLVFLRARYFDPGTGRFISKDPLPGYVRWPQTLNPYPYATNNPATLTDPSGQQVPAKARDIIDRIVWEDTNGGVDALIRLFETDELNSYDPPASNTARARLELVLEATNRRLPGGIDAGIQFAIDFTTCGLQGQFNDEWLYRKYWNQNPDDPNVANQVGHFLTAVRLGYDPTFLVPLITLEIGMFVTIPEVRPLLPMDESIAVTAKRLIIGHEKVGDPLPTGDQVRDAALTALNIPRQYGAAKLEDVNYFDLAVGADRRWDNAERDDYLLKILLDSRTDDDIRQKRQGNSMEDLRLSVKGWRLGRAVAGLDGSANPPEKQLTNRLEVASWLRIHIAMPHLPIILK